MLHEPLNEAQVNDRWIFRFVYPAIAFLVVHVGNDNDFLKLIRIPSYYSDLLLSFLCTYGAGLYIRWLFAKLNRRHEWGLQLKRRLWMQFLYGLLAPTVVLFLIETAYLTLLLDMRLTDSSILYLELPLIILFCLLINLFYVILFYKKHLSILTTERSELSKKVLSPPAGFKNSVLIHQGAQSKNLPVQEVAYFFVRNGTTFLVTHEGRQFLYGSTLEKLKKELDPRCFFPLNRQVVASKASIHSCERTPTRKLKIELQPPATNPQFVAKTKAAEFLKWLDR